MTKRKDKVSGSKRFLLYKENKFLNTVLEYCEGWLSEHAGIMRSEDIKELKQAIKEVKKIKI